MWDELSLLNLNWFDYFVLIVISVTTLVALLSGFTRSLLFIITWGGATLAAIFLSPFVLAYFSNLFPSIEINRFLLATIVFIISLVFFFVLGYYIKPFLKNKKWGIFDKSLGLLFGLIIGIFFASLLFFTIEKTAHLLNLDEKSSALSWYYKAETYNALNISTSVLTSFLPDDYTSVLETKMGEVKDSSLKLLELESKTSVNNVLEEEDSQTMKDVLMALPSDKKQDSFNKFHNADKKLSSEQTRKFFNDILQLYKASLTRGEVSKADAIDDERIKKLEASLSDSDTGDAAEYDTGYQENNLKQLNRLIDTIE